MTLKGNYSNQYKKIRKEAENNWPLWKVELYNNIAISAHACKLERK